MAGARTSELDAGTKGAPGCASRGATGTSAAGEGASRSARGTSHRPARSSPVRAGARKTSAGTSQPAGGTALRLAGTEVPLFAPTVEAIDQAASGLPRKANSLAHHALFGAAIAKATTVTTEHVQAAMQEVASLIPSNVLTPGSPRLPRGAPASRFVKTLLFGSSSSWSTFASAMVATYAPVTKAGEAAYSQVVQLLVA